MSHGQLLAIIVIMRLLQSIHNVSGLSRFRKLEKRVKDLEQGKRGRK